MLPEPDNKIMQFLERIKSETTKLVSILINKLRHIFLGRMSDWINLAEDRNRWWAFMNAVMNFQVP
jgi:hypothetical protein